MIPYDKLIDLFKGKDPRLFASVYVPGSPLKGSNVEWRRGVTVSYTHLFTDINPSDVPAKLAELTGMKYHYFVHALNIESGGDYGNACLLYTSWIR